VTYICIRCGRKWVVCNPSNHASGSLCEPCMTDYVRCKQKKNGFADCYKRAVEVCSEDDCAYHELCCRNL
jgi:hypothetical protein